jgi:hypothetical protein
MIAAIAGILAAVQTALCAPALWRTAQKKQFNAQRKAQYKTPGNNAFEQNGAAGRH